MTNTIAAGIKRPRICINWNVPFQTPISKKLFWSERLVWSKTAAKILLLLQAFFRYFCPFFQTVLRPRRWLYCFFLFHYFFLFIVCALLKTKLSSTVAYWSPSKVWISSWVFKLSKIQLSNKKGSYFFHISYQNYQQRG